MTQLIKMEGVTKIFRTEDVETHALSDINLTIDRGDYVSISGPLSDEMTTSVDSS